MHDSKGIGANNPVAAAAADGGHRIARATRKARDRRNFLRRLYLALRTGALLPKPDSFSPLHSFAVQHLRVAAQRESGDHSLEGGYGQDSRYMAGGNGQERRYGRFPPPL